MGTVAVRGHSWLSVAIFVAWLFFVAARGYLIAFPWLAVAVRGCSRLSLTKLATWQLSRVSNFQNAKHIHAPVAKDCHEHSREKDSHALQSIAKRNLTIAA